VKLDFFCGCRIFFFGRDTGHFCADIATPDFFCADIPLFCVSIGLFCVDIGLFV